MTELLTHQDRPADLDRLLCEISELRAQLERIQNFRTFPDEVHDLPDTVHHYTYFVQALAAPISEDPALIYTRQSLQALARLNDELRKLLGECFNLDV